MDVPASPISTRERIATLDAVRGFALLGIFIMNIGPFHQPLFLEAVENPSWPMWWDQAAVAARNVLFAGKFNGMFSMLFAVGFTIQLERLRERDPAHANAIYLRRVLWLLAFGLLHACLFWTGDVLHIYALFGLLLIFVLHRLSDRILIALMGLLLIYPLIGNAIAAQFSDAQSMQELMKAFDALNAAQDAASGHGTFWEAARQNVQTMWLLYTGPWNWRFIPGMYATIGVTMLLGLLLGRHRIFQNIQSYMPLVKRIQYVSIGVGIAGGAVFAVWRATTESPMQPTVFKAIAGFCFAISRVAVMSFYVTTIVRALHSDKWRPWLQPIVLTGRMPLTNYLLQTLIATFVFTGWGLGHWRETGPAVDLAFALAVYFIIQVPLSVFWLRRFERGPMEALWRKLTYWHAENRTKSCRTTASGGEIS